LREPRIIRQWETTEIDPEEIAKYLHGELEESDDSDSKWNVHLYYRQRTTPTITLKLDPEARKMYIAVHGSRNSYYVSSGLFNIETLLFVHWEDPYNKNKHHTDIRVLARNDGFVAWDTLLSSKGHRAFL